MALKSNRVGVRTDQVDEYGRVISKSFFQSLIDHLPRWTSLKVWKNGTEQLLPVNTDEPVTSPIVADIQYPTDSSATEQMFTYRKSPTDADGEAYIQSIKGNTIVWNQLVANGNFTSTTGWGQGGSRSSLTVSDNVGTATLINSLSTTYQNYSTVELVQGHKIFVHYEFKVPRATTRVFACENNKTATAYIFSDLRNVPANTWQTVNALHTVVTGGTETLTFCYFTTSQDNYELGDQYQIKNCYCVDLTQMFGAGNEPATVEEFTALFPLPYYKYDAGSLLSFNGTGIKTTGKNQLDISVFSEAAAYTVNDNGSLTVKSSDPRAWNNVVTFPLKKGNYVFTRSVPNGVCDIRFGYENFAITHTIANQVASSSFTVEQDTDVKIKVGYSYSEYPFTTNVMIRFADTDSAFEPYTTSTTTILTDTYFPTGMKSVGTVYDEFNSSRAYTRIGEVDLGTLTWGYNSSYGMNSSGLNSVIKKPSTNNDIANILCPVRNTTSYNSVYNAGTSGNNVGVTSTGTLTVNTTETNSATFKTAMSGVYLYYELAEEIIEPTLEFDE